MKLKLTGVVASSLIVAACNSSTDLPLADVDAAPTISALADRSIMANAPSDPIAFSVTDEKASALDFTLMSDNAGLVPVSHIAVDGSGTDRALTITPVEDQTGDSMVTVIVADSAGLMASTSFLLTVTAETRSLQQFTRAQFATSEDGDPALLNAVDFNRDAQSDDFADLLER